MLKKLTTLLMCFSLAGMMSVLAGNPMNFREYTQEFSIEFESPEATQAASISLRPLPGDYVLALSARWDDTNLQHSVTHDLMMKHGIKGTFFLTGLPNGEYIRQAAELVKGGCSLGVHTIGHPFIITRNPHSQFRQYMKNRIEEEVASQTVVNSTVQPFGGVTWGRLPEVGLSIGRSLMATGIIGSPDFYTNNKNFEASIGYPKGAIAMSRVLTPGDGMPDLDVFESQLANYLADKETLARHPSITMGVHSCHSAGEGQARLDEELRRLSGHDDWWYCNQNEYAAYRYEANNDALEITRDGNTMHVKVTRMETAELGADVPLWFTIGNATPVSVSGAELKKNQVCLPHAHSSLPTVIGLANSEGKIDKIPAIALKFKEEDGFWKADIVNNSQDSLNDIWITFRFSGKVDEPVVRKTIDSLAPAEGTICTVPVQTSPDDPYFNGGLPLGVAQIDFTTNGQRCRAFAMADGTKIATPTTAAQVVRFFKLPVDAEPDMASLSMPGTPVDFPAYGYSDGGLSAPGFIQPPFADNKTSKPVQIVEFTPKKSGTYKLCLDAGGEHGEFWLNGNCLGKNSGTYDVELKKGRNRIAVIVRYVTFNYISFERSADDAAEPIEFIEFSSDDSQTEENDEMAKILPAPDFKGTMTLMEALNKRSSSRDYTPGAALSDQELAEILWCANGFNRDKMRTAPSAVNAQAITVYVFDAAAVWEYQPEDNRLVKIKDGDHRADTGMQPFVKDAAVNLVYVYDKSKWPMAGGTDGKFAAVDAAFCAENVYLYCASKGLKTVVRGSFDQTKLLKLLDLPADTMCVGLAQCIGK